MRLITAGSTREGHAPTFAAAHWERWKDGVGGAAVMSATRPSQDTGVPGGLLQRVAAT